MSNRPSHLPYKPIGEEIVAKRREIYEATGIMPPISIVVQQLKQANAIP